MAGKPPLLISEAGFYKLALRSRRPEAQRFADWVTSTEPLTMTSREIAELTGKEHFHVKRDITNMMEDLGEDASKFGGMSTDAYGRPLAVFNLDKELTTTLCAGYSTILRRRIVARWMELENAKAQPVALTPTQALLGIVQNMVDIERQQQALAAQAQAHTQALVEVTEKVQGLEDARLVPVHAKRPLARLSSSTNRIPMLIVFAHKAYA